jgi:Mn2+/Fe2+ NRAMP family transporter
LSSVLGDALAGTVVARARRRPRRDLRAALLEALIVAPWLVVVARGGRTRTRVLAVALAVAGVLTTVALTRPP